MYGNIKELLMCVCVGGVKPRSLQILGKSHTNLFYVKDPTSHPSSFEWLIRISRCYQRETMGLDGGRQELIGFSVLELSASVPSTIWHLHFKCCLMMHSSGDARLDPWLPCRRKPGEMILKVLSKLLAKAVSLHLLPTLPPMPFCCPSQGLSFPPKPSDLLMIQLLSSGAFPDKRQGQFCPVPGPSAW